MVIEGGTVIVAGGAIASTLVGRLIWEKLTGADKVARRSDDVFVRKETCVVCKQGERSEAANLRDFIQAVDGKVDRVRQATDENQRLLVKIAGKVGAT